jgi:hypothetical protein
MRCPACEAQNADGDAFCANCAAPLTAYAGASVADADPARSAQRLAQLNTRPPIVLASAIADMLAALWAVGVVVRAAASRPALSEDAVNYVGHAFGGLSAVLVAAAMLPLAAALAALAWGAVTQRTWAWIGNAALMGVAMLVGLSRMKGAPIVGFPIVAMSACLAYVWLQPATRRWYGIDDGGAA